MNLAITKRPVRLQHFYQPLAFGSVYGVFSLVYYLAGGCDIYGHRYIYPILDWDQPGKSAVFVLLTVCVVCLLHVAVYSLYKVRNKVYQTYVVQTKYNIGSQVA